MGKGGYRTTKDNEKKEEPKWDLDEAFSYLEFLAKADKINKELKKQK